ncbi:hypothetical protein [Demequina sp. NBRC 110051]|uniref:hypothetical protein n=1 Tax=Demequina sp. NBRC 110051 TaxID=1570340 RepID=UPI000A066A85|nr:hypothetical protein [Demequina sp. NBRC 110051]
MTVTSPSTRAPIDPARLIAFTSTEGRAIMLLFIVTNAAFAWGTVGFAERPWQTAYALALVAAGGILIVVKHPYPYPWRYTAAILGIVLASNALVFDTLRDGGELGRATWNLGANTWLLFFLTIRGRPWAAWIGMAAMIAETAVWAAATDRGVMAGVSMCSNHVGILLVGTLFAGLLKRTAARIDALRERALTAAAETAAADAGIEIRRARMEELAALALPHLERISAGGPFSDDERAAFARTEARLRDGVRGRALALPEVVEATEEARARGVSVTILDDRGEVIDDGDALARMVEVIVRTLRSAFSGSVTVRLQPRGRDSVLTLLHVDGDEATRIALDEHGHPVGPRTDAAHGIGRP